MHFFLSCSWFFLKFWSSKMVLRKKKGIYTTFKKKNVDATSPKHAPLLAFSENPAPDSYF